MVLRTEALSSQNLVSLSLAVNSIADPEEYLEADAPEDNRSPLIEVFASGTNPINSRERLWAIACSVAMTYVGDARPSKSEEFINQYITALIDLLNDSPTLAGTVTYAEITGIFMASRGDDSESRKAAVANVDVHVCEVT